MPKKFLSLMLVLIVIATLGYILYTSKFNRNVYESAFEPYNCNLTKDECDRLDDYKKAGWQVKKFKNGDNSSQNIVLGLFKKVYSFSTDYTIVANVTEKKIVSRLPEPKIFDTVLKKAEVDTTLISLLRTNPFLHSSIIDRLEFPRNKGDDYFDFAVSVSDGKKGYGEGCTKSYYIYFSLSGDIIKQGITDTYCPDPL